MPAARQTRIPDLLDRIRPGRRIDGCSAVLLPYTAGGDIDWDGFRHLVRQTDAAGLTPAINMDTGYGPHLAPAERTEVLRLTRETLGPDARVIAGAGIFGWDGDPVAGYRATIDEIRTFDATPIIFQSEWLSAQTGAALADAYRAIIGDAPAAIGFELGTMFAPFGRIYDLDEYRRLLDVEPLIGAKHSSLDRFMELYRLALRDEHRPDFKVYTGNDLAIDMVMYGSDYLLGLSAFHVDAFAMRDAWWADGDPRFFPLNDALQAVGMIGFRPPVPAYKHSAAVFLALRDHIRADATHPSCPRRGDGEAALLEPFLDMIAAALCAPQP